MVLISGRGILGVKTRFAGQGVRLRQDHTRNMLSSLLSNIATTVDVVLSASCLGAVLSFFTYMRHYEMVVAKYRRHYEMVVESGLPTMLYSSMLCNDVN